ncbi:GNAT family N-acetyltransferase [Pedobacter chitinilyticus]|uniref:GNAT family N-acetyltransferase n=1 Tax=Pedobacter chitinilyticus TaxID=2233776 RepID=A0A3S4RQC4_9SPHI|nr:GNAT family N-acetyltransferase [Pedobacter chitinilyticus]RWU07469.1 GNAT family N-acetyltransferase [Pedobacter chitinilyticus]
MTVKTLADIDIPQMAEAINQSFADYIVPFQLNTEQLQYKIIQEDVDLNLSVGVFDGNALVGIMLHGLRKNNDDLVAYNAATGVIPTYRGKGLVGKMYHFLMPKLQALQVQKMVLEVIEGNEPAIKAYEKMGYTISRKLVCFSGTAKAEETQKEISIKEATAFQWNKWLSFWDIQPSWQNAVQSVQNSKAICKVLEAYLNEVLVGYLIYNANSKKVNQFAVSPSHRQKGIATALFSHLQQVLNSEVYVYNIDGTSLACISFLKTLGLKEKVKQLEMERAV